MKAPLAKRILRGFTLMETVIAIGVLAVLLSAFVAVFGPAADGIRRSISEQDADRLAATLERELVTVRTGQNFPTGFAKGFEYVKGSQTAATALLAYKYRGDLASTRTDGTPQPLVNAKGKIAGKDYAMVPMVRRKDDTLFLDDIEAVEGPVLLVKCTQMIESVSGMVLGTPGTIKDPVSGAVVADADAYTAGSLVYQAQFHILSSRSDGFFTGASFGNAFDKARHPVSTRFLAASR